MVTEIKKIIYLPAIWITVLLFILLNCFMIYNKFHSYENLDNIYRLIIDQTLDQKIINQYIPMYDNLDMMNILEVKQDMYDYHPSGDFQSFIESNYQKLQQRVEEIKDSKESDQLFYPGDYYRLHTFLYKNIMSYLIIEILILTLVSVLYVMDFERLKQTQEIVYSSKIGKKIQRKKVMSGLLVGIIIGAFLMVVTLSYYFATVSYQGLWDVSVSSAMASVPRGVLYYPLITFFKLSNLQYLLITIALSFILIFITVLMVVGIQLLLNNSYLSFLASMLLLLVFYYVSTFQTESWIDIILAMNPTMFWYYCGGWLIENEIHLSFNGFEVLSLSVQSLVITIILWICYKRYLHQDIKC